MAPLHRNGKTPPPDSSRTGSPHEGSPAPRILTKLLVAALLAGFAVAQSLPEGNVNTVRGLPLPATAPLPEGSWRFIVSGDSRNCGDIVMPAIAAHSTRFAPSFYWHLGDLRAIYAIDEDIAFAKVPARVTPRVVRPIRDWPGTISPSIKSPHSAIRRSTWGLATTR